MTTTTKLLAERAGQLDAMDDGSAVTPAPVPAAEPVTPAPASASPQPATTGEVVVLVDARARADARKAAHEAVVDGAMLALSDAVEVIRKTFTEKGADFDDACKALPLLHKVLEHVDRMEAAAKVTKSWPLLNFQIILDPSVPQVPPPNKRSRALEMVDVVDPDA